MHNLLINFLLRNVLTITFLKSFSLQGGKLNLSFCFNKSKYIYLGLTLCISTCKTVILLGFFTFNYNYLIYASFQVF